jgi:hypothetical protein
MGPTVPARSNNLTHAFGIAAAILVELRSQSGLGMTGIETDRLQEAASSSCTSQGISGPISIQIRRLEPCWRRI